MKTRTDWPDSMYPDTPALFPSHPSSSLLVVLPPPLFLKMSVRETSHDIPSGTLLPRRCNYYSGQIVQWRCFYRPFAAYRLAKTGRQHNSLPWITLTDTISQTSDLPLRTPLANFEVRTERYVCAVTQAAIGNNSEQHSILRTSARRKLSNISLKCKYSLDTSNEHG